MAPMGKSTELKNKAALSVHLPPPPRGATSRQPPAFAFQKFNSPEHEERHKEISLKRFVQERAFDCKKQAWPEIRHALRNLGLLKLNDLIAPANRSIATEFLANAMLVPGDAGNNRVMVRGKEVYFGENDINRLLGLDPPEECAVERRIRELEGMDEERRTTEILYELCREGAEWYRHTAGKIPNKFRQRDMKPVPRVWSHFFVQNIVTNSNASEVIVKRAVAIQAIIAGESINFGRLISQDLRRIANEHQSSFSLGHCALINALCEKRGVLCADGDLDEGVMKPMTYAWYVSLEMGPIRGEHEQGHQQHEEEEEPQEMEEDAQVPPQQQPHYFNSYNFAMANFAEDFAGMMLSDVPQFEGEFKAAADNYRQVHPQHPYIRYGGDRANMLMHFTHQKELLELRQKQTADLFDQQHQIAQTFGANIEDFGEGQSHHQQGFGQD